MPFNKRISRKKKKAIKNFLLYVLTIVLMTAFAYAYTWINGYLQERLTSFKLVDVDIKGNYILSRNDVLEICGVSPGEDQLLTVKPVEVAGKLLKSPYIKAASVVRSLPSTLRIIIVERAPLAFIYGRGLNLIDAEGVLIPVPEKNIRWNLPFITEVDLPLGRLGHQTRSQKALQAVEVLDYMHLMQSSLNEVIAEINMEHPRHLKFILVQGGAEVRIDKAAYQDQLYIFSRYLENYMDWYQLDQIEYVDFRFRDQLIIKEKQG